jgi:hypothetical protein
LFVALAGIRLGHGVRLREGGRIEGHDGHGTVLGSHEDAPALVEESLKLLCAGGRDLTGHGRRQEEIGCRTALAGIAVQGLLCHCRHVNVPGDGLRQVKAGHGSALLLHEAGLGKVHIAQGLVEEGTIELAIGSLESRVVHDRGRNELVGDGEAHLPGPLGHDGFGHEVVDHLLVKTERASLLRADDGAELAPEPLQLVGIGVADLLDRDCRVADLSHRGSGCCTKDVANAPDGEADDQGAKKDGGDGFADHSLPSLAHVPKHREPVS